MGEIRVTRDFFLWSMSVIYLSAFASLYHQMPGLYGDRGILPVRSVVPVDTNPRAAQQKAHQLPTLLWLAPNFGLKVSTMMEFLGLLGILMSFIATIWSRFRDCINFALLWILYFSLYQVGQTFMWFQWDILLLEVGFLCILVAPLGMFQRTLGLSSSWRLPHNPHDKVSVWLLRWLLFRFMFSSGVVKLTSMCPAWWGLHALNVHFESQCIPTPVAWYFHHLPEWFLRLGVVFTYVVEIAVPFLFFVPVRSLRIFSFYCQVLLQLLILVTGNYNFFNLLTLALCLSLVDDEYLLNAVGRSTFYRKSLMRTTRRVLAKTASLLTLCCLTFATVKLFQVQLYPDWTFGCRIAFTPKQFEELLAKTMPVTIWMGAASLAVTILLSLQRSFFSLNQYTVLQEDDKCMAEERHNGGNAACRSLFEERGLLRKLFSTCGTVLCSTAAVWLFCVSLVPFSTLDYNLHSKLWPVVRQWHSKVEPFHVASSYGLFRRQVLASSPWPPVSLVAGQVLVFNWRFSPSLRVGDIFLARRMTGLEGRPELVLEGGDQPTGPWKELPFLYKPGNVTRSPPFVVPHQPRLDWQMWFAALDRYERNPWLLSLVHRILTGQEQVLALLDREHYPFAKQPPKYVRGLLYTYRFTQFNAKSRVPNVNDWWKRSKPTEYLPPLHKEQPFLRQFLEKAEIPMDSPKLRSRNGFLKPILAKSRELANAMSPTVYVWSFITSAMVLKLVGTL
ncbi:lipase maturation factor, putative, partial [Ixodes scapularis]